MGSEMCIRDRSECVLIAKKREMMCVRFEFSLHRVLSAPPVFPPRKRFTQILLSRPGAWRTVCGIRRGATFYELPGYSRVLPGLLIPVTGTSKTSYSSSIWAPGTRVLGYPFVHVGNPGHVNLSCPESRPLGSISYICSRNI